MNSVALLDFFFCFLVLHVPLLAQQFRDGEPSVFVRIATVFGMVGVRLYPAGYGMVAYLRRLRKEGGIVISPGRPWLLCIYPFSLRLY